MNTTIAIVLVVAIVGAFLILAIAWLVHAYVTTKPITPPPEIDDILPPMRRVFVDRGRVLPKPSSVRSAWFRSRWLKSNGSLNRNVASIPSTTPESPRGTKHFSIYVREKTVDEEHGRPFSLAGETDSSVDSSDTTRQGRRIHRTPTFASIKAVAISHARAARPQRPTTTRHKSLPTNFTDDPILEKPAPVRLSPLQSRYAVLEPSEPFRLTEHLENIRRAHQQRPMESPEYPDPKVERTARRERLHRAKARETSYQAESRDAANQ